MKTNSAKILFKEDNVCSEDVILTYLYEQPYKHKAIREYKL